jgi:hypothetical protein
MFRLPMLLISPISRTKSKRAMSDTDPNGLSSMMKRMISDWVAAPLGERQARRTTDAAMLAGRGNRAVDSTKDVETNCGQIISHVTTLSWHE